MRSNQDRHPAEWSRGWPILFAASAGYGMSGGLFSLTAGLFINPMRNEFGWTMSQVAIAPYVHLLIALMMPLGGMVINRVGPRPVAIFGVLLFTAGYIALAILPLSLVLLYAIVGCMGLMGQSVNAGLISGSLRPGFGAMLAWRSASPPPVHLCRHISVAAGHCCHHPLGMAQRLECNPAGGSSLRPALASGRFLLFVPPSRSAYIYPIYSLFFRMLASRLRPAPCIEAFLRSRLALEGSVAACSSTGSGASGSRRSRSLWGPWGASSSPP